MKFYSILKISSSILVSGLLLSGCQHIKLAPQLEPQTTQQHTQADLVNFQITGKIGVRTPEQNGSAFYGWTQNGDLFAIDLTGALGIGQTSIRGRKGDVTLTNSKTGVIQATTPEELLYKATKWEAPITYLVSWINAQPIEKNAIVEFDTANRPKSIREGGWLVNFTYKDTDKLPNKLVLVDDAEQNRVTLTIQTRQ